VTLTASAACATRGPVQAQRPSPPAAAPTPPPITLSPAGAATIDPIAILLADADRDVLRGQGELSQGHLGEARAAFDAAVDRLLEAPADLRRDPRVRTHLFRLVDQIGRIEQEALAAGNGFRESLTEPASIDALLALDDADRVAPGAVTASAVAVDLQTTEHDLPIPSDDRVLRWVEIFQGRLREFLTEGLARGAQYLPMVRDVFQSEGLPTDLAYVPLIESAFKPSALSRTRARGVWQFMRGTALENGLKTDWFLDERADPEKSTVAAARYFKTLYGMFGDWHLAMASYNGGPGRVQRAMKRSGKSDFWSLTATTRYLPRETRDYVPMILAAALIARNPAQYGFDIPEWPVTPTETVTLPAAVDLRRVAEWTATPIDTIQQLNPELRRWTTPIRPGDYAVRVPVGTADAVRTGLAAAEPHQLNALQWHTVKRGDTLATIARKLRVPRADLADANYLRTSARLAPGQRLLVPRMPSAALLARAVGSPLPQTAMLAAPPDASPAPRATAPVRVVYRVRKGDTLSAIARRHGVSVEAIKNWNRLSSSALSIGTRLVIRSERNAND
jgi:membrane-bound lytic murein transglycosylase D